MKFYNSVDVSDNTTVIGILDSDNLPTVKCKIVSGTYKGTVASVSKNDIFGLIITRLVQSIPTHVISSIRNNTSSFAEKLVRLIDVLDFVNLAFEKFNYPNIMYRTTNTKTQMDLINEITQTSEYQKIQDIFPSLVDRNDMQNIGWCSRHPRHKIISLFDNITVPYIHTKIPAKTIDVNGKKRTLSVQMDDIRLIDNSTTESLVIPEPVVVDIFGNKLKVGDIISGCTGSARMFVLRVEKISAAGITGLDIKTGSKSLFKILNNNCVVIDKEIMDRLLMEVLSR